MMITAVHMHQQVRRELALRMFGVRAERGRVVAYQLRRHRVQVEWADGARQWYAARELTPT